MPPLRSRVLLLLAYLALLTAVATAAPTTATSPAEATVEPSLRAPVTDPPEENALPIGMTPEEEAIRDQIGTYLRDTPPPAGPGIRQCAEWEPCTGALVRYPFGLPYALLREIAEDMELWVEVANSSEQNACTSALQNNGVNMANVRFLVAPTNSIWTRDYGPQFAFDANGDQGIIDHHYNRPRPQDDQINYFAGTAWGVPVYGSPLIHTGGNYMCDGHGTGYSTNLVYDENTLSDAQVNAYMQSYLGIHTYHVLPDIALGGIHHIDVWAKLLNEETILVKQLPTAHVDYARTEANVATLRTYTNCYGRPYKIVRVYCGTISGSSVAAYTNSVILDKKVLVPTFNLSTDAAALQTYRDAMPGYEVVGFTGSWLSDDAIHCRVMGIHDKYMLRVDCKPLADTVRTSAAVRLDVNIDDRSEMGLKADSLLVYWRTAGGGAFQPLTLAASGSPDSFYVDIPGQPAGTTVEYYVFAADNSNRRETRPPSAPAGYYKYYVTLDPVAVEESSPERAFALVSAKPNPFAASTAVRFRIPESGPVRLTVTDVSGRQVATLLDRTLPAGEHSAGWDGRDSGGRAVPDGIYFVRLDAAGRSQTARVVRIE